MATEEKAKLKATVAEMSDAEVKAYVDAHLPGGHKRKLAEEVLRLRALVKKGAKQ